MGFYKRFRILMISSFILSFIATSGIMAYEQGNIENHLSGIVTYNVNDFSDFNHLVDHEDIHTTKNNTHITFKYNGDNDTEAIYDRYQYWLPENCSDFTISLRLSYQANITEAIFISYMGVSGEDHGLTALEVWDAWTGSQAKHYIKGWPNGTADDTEDAAGSAGLSGTVTFVVSRVGDLFTSSIYNENLSTLYLGKTWTSGMSTLISGISINHRSGLLGASSQAVFYDIDAQFNKTTTPGFTFTFGPASGLLITCLVVSFAAISIIRSKNRKN